MHHPRQVLTRTQIFEHVWGYDFGPSSNSLEVYVGYLRRKLEAAEPRVIQTVRGVGYVLREQVSFRRRLALSCGAAVAIAVVLGSRARLLGRARHAARPDRRLAAHARRRWPPSLAVRGDPGAAAGAVAARTRCCSAASRPRSCASSRFADGTSATSEQVPPPLGDEQEMQAGRAGQARRRSSPTATIAGRTVRVLVSRGPDDLAIFAARPLTEVDDALGTLRWALGLLALGGIALAVVLSRLATRTAIRPVVTLTETAEHVATTRDLSRRDRRAGRGRGLAPGDLVQHDARGARALAARAAPARRRRRRTSCARR